METIKNRVLFYKNHACNTSPKAHEIGVQQLQRISACVGHKGGLHWILIPLTIQHLGLGVFLNTPIKIDVRLEDSPTYGVQNVVKKFFSLQQQIKHLLCQSQPVATTPVTTALKQEDFANLWGNRS